MAISNALAWQLNNGGSADTLYGIIRDFLATSPDAATTQAQMAQYGISGEDVANATGGASGGLLGGNILAGASWNSLNTALPEQLTAATGQATSNYAVGGATTADTLAQLNTFLAGGGQFDPNATVYLQTGGVDFLQGVDKGTIKDNINQIVKTLGAQGVDVVLTGSPYAKSIDDVINNNFDPKVDQIFTDIAKENKNVALVGVQGEILQNKKLLVDALHTNAEGTAIYNQAVIDSLSQFKNEVPSSTPQAIAQAYQTNTVATTPPIITQAAASPIVAQTLADVITPPDATPPIITQAAASPPVSKASSNVIPTARGTVIEGDDIEAQIAGVPQVVYETRVDPNNKANWQTVNPKTGEVIDSGTFAGGGDQGLLRAAAPIVGLAASTVGLPFITSLLSGATGLTGSALAGATGATIGAGTQAVTGGSTKDILTAALLGGGASYLGNALSNLDVPVDFNNMTADELNDALQTNLVKDLKQAGAGSPQEFLTGQGRAAGTYIQESVAASNLANNLSAQGLNSGEIAQLLDSAGFVPTAITDALDSLAVVAPVAVSTPVTDGGAVNITSPTTPSLNNVLSTIASTTPAVTVTAPKTTGMTTQEVLNLVESQLAANAGTPANLGTPTNLANVEVTGDRLATTQEIANAVIATVPNITTQQAQAIAEQVITSGQPVTNQDVVNAITATIPALTTATTPIATQTITGQKPITTQEIVNAITASIPAVTTPVTTPTTTPLATQTITAPKEVATQEIVNAITASLPATTTPVSTTPIATQTITGQKPATVEEIVNAITATIPTVTPTQAQTVAQQVITADRPVTTQEVINAITAAIPTVTTPTTLPTTTITADRPVVTPEIINAITAAIPTITTPTTPTTVPTTTITAPSTTVTTQDVINAIAATIPTVPTATVPAVIPTTPDSRVTITADRPSSITDAVTAATIPLIQPSTPLTVPQVTTQTPVDPLRVAQLGLTAAGLLGAGSALSSGGSTQFPIVPVPESWTSPITGTTGTTGTTAYSQLPAINFGDRNLLRGTQWEKFLDPNYGRVPAPVQYSQPSSLSYNDLMGILGSRQGMPARSNLSINDIISGIQNQYGQTPVSTVG
jgi:hypothetical protein